MNWVNLANMVSLRTGKRVGRCRSICSSRAGQWLAGVALLLAGLVPRTGPSAGEESSFRRGDVTADGRVDVTDAIFLLTHEFQNGPAPSCLDAADINDDGAIDIGDPMFALFHLFLDRPPPPPPGPAQCGLDPNEDPLDCAAHPPCDATPNQPPVAAFMAKPVQGPAPLVVTLDASASFDPDGTIKATYWTLGDGGTASAVTLTHTYQREDSYTVTLLVVDDDGAAAGSSSIVTVTRANNSPILDTIGDRTATVGRTLTISVVATDPDGDAVTLGVDPLPLNAVFEASAGAFAFTPDATQVGSLHVTFSASDGRGGLDDEGVTIAVREEPPPGDDLSTAAGCAGVFNPDQVLDYHLALDPEDWEALQADQTNSLYFAARLGCGGQEPISVGVRRKPSGGGKTGLKVDVNRIAPEQDYFGLKNLVLESGTSTGSIRPSLRELIAEYLGWRLMQRSGAHASRAAFARVHVNGEYLGVFINVEAVDTRFLESRFGDASGWLWEEGPTGGEWKTNEGIPDPYAPALCFFGEAGESCQTPSPAELATLLPARVDLNQLLRVGAVNALMGNENSLLMEQDNYYFYDWPGGRVYLPWDLDGVTEGWPDVFASWNAIFSYVLLERWQDDYSRILSELIAGALGPEGITEEMNRVLAVAGSVLESDPHFAGLSSADTIAALAGWWQARHAEVRRQLSMRRCRGAFDIDSVAQYQLGLEASYWNALVNDTTNSRYFPAELRCNDHGPFIVGVRRKRSGGTEKVGLKVDINHYVDGQTFFGLKKLSLENGISEGDASSSIEALASEYLAWRLMDLSGAHASRAAFIRLQVNEDDLGVYVSVEQVDTSFLRTRLGDDGGWLYKKSGGEDGYQTNEGVPNPFEERFCFWANGARACGVPSAAELAATLPGYLDIDQMLRMGGVSAFISNTDGPLVKDNNYHFYDFEGGRRVYIPWDLDTVMRDSLNVFTRMAEKYSDVLFTHWEDDYDLILTELIAGPLRLEAVHAEIEKAFSVAGADLEADPYLSGDSAPATRSRLRDWWSARHAAVTLQVNSH
jgi:spore coat protein CotH